MRKLMIAGLMAATILPAAPAMAQTWGDFGRTTSPELRQQQRELRQAQRWGDRRDIQRERRDVREARRDLRRDIREHRRWNRNDWRDYRTSNRAIFSRGHWRAPFRYRTWAPGYRIAPNYFHTSFIIADPWRYRLPYHGGNLRWVRHYDDVLLVDVRRGIVVDVIRNFYW